MSRYFNRQGEPLELLEWARLVEEPGYSTVAKDELVDGTLVSTVWIGLNHAWDGGPPLIFETMIFGGRHDEEQWRYSTEADAVAGHAKALELARDAA